MSCLSYAIFCRPAAKTSVLEAAVELLRAGSHLRTHPGRLEDVGSAVGAEGVENPDWVVI
jgi:hypothetical protein